MKSQRPVKLAILAFTIWPLTYGLIFAVALLMAAVEGRPGDGLPIDSSAFLVLHFAAALSVVGLYGFYGWHILKNPSLPERSAWLLALVLLGLLMMPVYWVLHIWKPGRPTAVS